MRIDYIDLSTQDGMVTINVNGLCNHAEAYVFETSKYGNEQLVVCPVCDDQWINEVEIDEYHDMEGYYGY